MLQKNTSRVTVDKVLSLLCRISGWFWAVFWVTIGVVGLFQVLAGKPDAKAVDWAMPFICLGIAALNVRLIRYANRLSQLLKDFRLYCAVFAREPDKSIPDLAAALNLPAEDVLKRLQTMCKRGYFNGYIDFQQQRMLLDTAGGDSKVISCPGCGARSAVSAPGGRCPYCGSPL